MDARDWGYSGLNWDPSSDNIRNWWKNSNTSDENRLQSLRNAGYSGENIINNTNTERIKTNTEYKLPHRSR
jgi:hypothetical protein